jgi:hypothetical protein
VIRHFPLVLTAVAAAGAVAGCSGSSSGSSSAETPVAATPVTGTLELAAGNCNLGPSTGSFFFMVEPGGTLDNGPFVSNPDSPCAGDKTKTLLAPGTSGGLTFGSYQPQPAKPFGAGGNSAATAITVPTRFFGVDLGISTNSTDPQTGKRVPAPTATVKGKALTASLGGWSVSWNGQQFNQGAPKPGN